MCTNTDKKKVQLPANPAECEEPGMRAPRVNDMSTMARHGEPAIMTTKQRKKRRQ